MAKIVKLQVTERVKRTGDKENSTNESVNQGIALCRYVTATYHYVMAIYRHLPFFVILTSTVTTRAEAHLVKTKYSQYWNETNRALTVHLRPAKRPYDSFTARRKAVRFTLQTVSRTYGQLGAPFGRQPRRHLGRNFVCISCVL